MCGGAPSVITIEQTSPARFADGADRSVTIFENPREISSGLGTGQPLACPRQTPLRVHDNLRIGLLDEGLSSG